MKRQKLPGLRGLAGLVAAALMLTACSSGTSEEGSTATAGETQEQQQTLTVAIGQDLGTLDIRQFGSAASFSVLRHITEPLVAFTADGEVEPALAESWEEIDETTTRFNLRQGVTFSNGNPFNAEAVKYSIDKVLSDDFQAWNKSYVDGLIESVEVVDEQTVDVKLTGPSTRLVRELTTLDIIDPAHDATGAQETDPVGTGPFLFESFTPRQEIRLTANPDWWGDGPGVDELIVRIIPDQSTRVAALEAGEVQMIDTLPFQSIESIQNGANTTVLTGDTVRLIFLALNNKTAPFDDPLVRQAVNYAIDKNQITETILQGSALVPGGPCAPGVLDCLTDLEYPFDPDRAKSLLAEAGYAGEPLELTIGTGRYPNDDLVGQALAKMLEDVGFNVTLNVIDFASMRSQMSEAGADSPFDMWMVGWSASDNVLTSMLQSLFVADSAAYAIGYDNPEVTRLLDAASNTADPAVTTENVQEAQQIIWDEAPVGFLYVPKQNIGVSKDLSGFEPRFDEYFFFWDATLS